MPELYKTTEYKAKRKSHYHLVYLKDSLSGKTSLDEGHVHQLIFDETGGFWLDDAVGHTHEIMEIVNNIPAPKEVDIALVDSVLEDWYASKEYWKDSIVSGEESEEFYCHRQWNEKDATKLESEDRAVITVNKAEKMVDNLSGYQRQNRTDITFLPQENSDNRVADLLKHFTKAELENCFYPREESKVFEDAMITGKGLFHDYMDFSKSIRGQIVIERFKWNEVDLAPHEKEDLQDCDYIIKNKWFSEDKIKSMYPGFKNLQPEKRVLKAYGAGTVGFVREAVSSPQYINTKKNEYRMLEREKKIYRQVDILVNPDDKFQFDAEGWSLEDKKKIKTIDKFYIIRQTRHKIRVTKICSDKLLDDYFLDDDETDFSITPLYCKLRNGEFWGKLEGAKDLCRLINRAYSQFVDIINKVANYGWFYDSETFPDDIAKKNWKKNAARPGFNQELSDISRMPIKVEGVKFPVELVNAIAMFNNDLRDVMNVNLEMLGIGDQNQSGIAIKQKIAQQLIGNDFLFDNLSMVKKTLGRKIIRHVQKWYPPERIWRVVANQSKKERVDIQGEPFDTYDPLVLHQLLAVSDLAKFDVVISENPASPSAMMSNFLLLMEVAGKGMDIPPQLIFEYAPIPNKQKAIDIMTQFQQGKAEQEKMKYDTEIQKTLINAQSRGGIQ